jgi:hypothetical protein
MLTKIRDGIDNMVKKIEENNRMTQFGFYSVSAGLLIYACYRKRPLKKFVKASDIPNHFITEKIVQRGVVTKIQSTQNNGPVLMVNHKPPIRLPFRSDQSLPIKISGINIGNLGYGWLEAVVKDKEVTFIPFSNYGSNVEAQVFLIEDPLKKPMDVGKALTSIGFAQTTNIPQKKDQYAQKYFKQLQSNESTAKFFHKGQWSNLPENFSWIRKGCEGLLFTLMPHYMRVPLLVRKVEIKEKKKKQKKTVK